MKWWDKLKKKMAPQKKTAWDGDLVEISADDIIKEAQVADYNDIQYIIYQAPDHPRQKIRINTNYSRQGKKIRLSTYYDRGLCDTLEAYDKMDNGSIESQAYGAWMDGAR